MLRTALCTLALFGFGSAVRAGELDKETTSKTTPPAATVATAPVAPTAGTPAGTELDKESPQAAYHYRGGWGYRGGYGYGGYRGFGYGGYRGYGYRPYYGGYGYGSYYGGYAYPSYYGFGVSPYGGFGYFW